METIEIITLEKFFTLEQPKQIDYLVTLKDKECNDFLDRVKKTDRSKFRRISGSVSSKRQQKSTFKDGFSSANIEKIQNTLPVKEIDISKIELNPYQPRKYFNEEKLDDLANSIKNNGQLQNILVSIDTTNNKIILIAGERRLRAIRKNFEKTNDDKFKVILANTLVDVSARDLKILAVTENTNRETMTMLETAMSCKSLNEENLSIEQIKEITSISTTSIQRLLKIAELPEQIKTIIIANKLYSESKIFQLTRLENINDQLEIIELIKNSINRDRLVKIVTDYIDPKKDKKITIKPIKEKIATSDISRLKSDFIDFESKYETLSDTSKDKATSILGKIEKLQAQLLKLD